MPFAVDEIRKLGETGHEVIAADTFATAPGSHSRHARAALLTPAPAEEPCAYVEAIAAALTEHGVERLIPSFEEVFYLASSRERLASLAELVFPEFETLARLHDKVRFTRLCDELGLEVAPWRVVESRAELEQATRELGDFFARPAYSRGGMELYTNRGGLAGALSLEDCDPSARRPWLVQPYVSGEDRCSYAIAREGRLTAHVGYIHPRTIQDSGGILFESIDDPQMSAACRRVIEATGYHGQLALDFIRTERELLVIECNPRATAGVSLLTAAEFAAALADSREAEPVLAPAGRRRKIAAALLRQMVLHWRELPAGLEALRSGGQDLYATLDDPLPGLFLPLSYVHVLRYRARRFGRKERSKLVAAYVDDLRWNGEHIPCPTS